jgi:hypothetical protein
MAIYLVQGNTGEYADYTEWCVCAFGDKEDADTFAEEANAWLREQGVHEDLDLIRDDADKIARTSPFDDGCLAYYTGTSYSVVEVPFTPGTSYFVREVPHTSKEA